jgi:uncharacterized membrane protein
MAKKYDTNPLDHDVKKIADQSLGNVDEDSATAELPSDLGAPDATDAQTNALNQPVPESRGPARPTGSGFNQPTAAANPMTRADIHTPGTGPAYLPPSSGSIGNQSAGFSNPSGYQPNYQSGNQPGYQPGAQAGYRPNYQPGYQPGYRPVGANPQYPPQYAPISPGGQPYGAAYGPRPNKGLGIDPNIEGGLCYFPWIGWIMSVLVLIKEPKTNMFARFHALQALLLHGGILALGIVIGMLSNIGGFAHETGMAIFFGILGGLIKFGAFVAFIILGILALQMKSPKVPVVSDLAEKFNK